VNEDLRKRCKYLAHLPEAADVVFVEADLEDVVGKDGLKAFDGLLKTRRSRRKEKAKKDERARIKAEEMEREKIRFEVLHTSASPPIAPYLPVTPPSPSPEPPTASPVQTTGAWGSRTFASALHSTPSTTRESSQPVQDAEDDADFDVAWHDLEVAQRSSGRKKGGRKKLVLLSSGAGRR